MSQKSKLQHFLSSASHAISSSDSDNDVPSETKKSQAFHQKWLKDFTWLQDNDREMFCHPCLQTKKSYPFTSGCTNFRLSTLEHHDKSKQQLILYFSFYSQNIQTHLF